MPMKKIFVGSLVFVLSFYAGFGAAQSKKAAALMIQKDLLEAKTRTETRPVLDRNMFSQNKYAYEAYGIAKEMPGVLDKLFCYCYCEVNPRFKHKSLLTCYTDAHASQCGVCMREAFVAKKMAMEGKSHEEIAMYLRDFYLKN